jgi:signal transduction histidine kinase
MRLFNQFRSLLAQSVLWIALPLALLMISLVVAGAFAYRQIVASLLIDRDRQLAILSAQQVSDAIKGYARVLETLATDAEIRSPSPAVRSTALADAANVLEVFNGGVRIVDQTGKVISAAPAETEQVETSVGGQAYFAAVRDQRRSIFSGVLTDARTGQYIIVVAVPMLDPGQQFVGALLGVVYLRDTPMGASVKNLIVGEAGYAYLIDREARVIFHPNADNIGADFSNRPFMKSVIAGESGGALWQNSSGEQIVQGYAPVEGIGWGLVIREPWDSVIAPARMYAAAVLAVGLGMLIAAAFLLWWGVRRITEPIRSLAAQTSRLAAGESIETVAASGILEIDALERAFNQMAEQIASYRAGLRRYVGAVTQSQEDERRRIARDLHDETIQSLLAIARRLELYQAVENNPAGPARLAELQTMVANTLQGVRELSQDLRPLVLEDLGLIPALRTLIHTLSLGQEPKLPIQLEVPATALPLTPEQELAFYRITQEALANIYKHAQASQVLIRLSVEAKTVRLEIKDDGAGFQPPATLGEFAQRGCFGLMGMQERAWAVGGWLSLISTPGQGTQVSVTLPLVRTFEINTVSGH